MPSMTHFHPKPRLSPHPLQWPTSVGLLIALGLPFVSVVVGSVVAASGASLIDRALGGIVRSWLIAVLLIFVVVAVERTSLASIGLRGLSRADWRWTMIAWGIGGISFWLTGPLLARLGLVTTSSGIGSIAQVPLVLRIAVALTAGITEEIIFRGYAIERLASLTGNVRLAGLLSWLLFTLVHLPAWGIGGTIQIGVWAAVATALYVSRRNLPANIVMHTLNDAVAFLVLPMLMTA